MTKEELRKQEKLIQALLPEVEKACGGIRLSHWNLTDKSLFFRKSYGFVTLDQLIAISKLFGTDEINFNFGASGERGYSEYTPSIPGEPGYVEVLRKNMKLEKLSLL